MSRQRFIYPDLFDSEKFGSLSHGARLLFIGLFTTADDFGRGRASPRNLRKAIFGFDEVTADQVDGWLRELLDLPRQSADDAPWVRVYEVDGARYYELPGWSKKQTPRWTAKSTIPAPTKRAPENHQQSRGLRQTAGDPPAVHRRSAGGPAAEEKRGSRGVGVVEGLKRREEGSSRQDPNSAAPGDPPEPGQEPDDSLDLTAENRQTVEPGQEPELEPTPEPTPEPEPEPDGDPEDHAAPYNLRGMLDKLARGSKTGSRLEGEPLRQAKARDAEKGLRSTDPKIRSQTADALWHRALAAAKKGVDQKPALRADLLRFELEAYPRTLTAVRAAGGEPALTAAASGGARTDAFRRVREAFLAAIDPPNRTPTTKPALEPQEAAR